MDDIKSELHKTTVIHQAAMQVRQILDTAKADYGDEWDQDEAEGELINLAT